MLKNTYAVIKANFPGPTNAGLRALLRRTALSIARGQNANQDLMFLASKVALTARGKNGLIAINSTFLQEK